MSIYLKKSFGQHLCIDNNIINQMITLSGDIKNKTVLEIGPGTGNLSQAILLKHPQKLIAIEKDKRMQTCLKELSDKHKNFQIIFEDINKYNIQNLFEFAPISIISNLPYNVSTTIILNLLSNIKIFDQMILMFQKEVAKRIIAKHGTKEYGSLSVISNLLCDIEYGIDVPPESFFPKPKVQSSIIKLTPKKINYEIDLLNMIGIVTKKLFSKKRKQLQNTLIEFGEKAMREIFLKLNIKPSTRAEELSVEEFLEITKIIKATII